jgi:hypothetical protein
MRRIVVYAAAIAVLLGTGAMEATGAIAEARLADSPAAGTESANAEWREVECRFNSLVAREWTAREERLTSQCALAKWGVDGGYPQFWAVGACESGWNRFASNGGRYLGLFQHSADYWRVRVRNMRPAHWSLAPAWSNSRSQIVVTARMVHAGGWGPWSCA